MEPEGLHNIRKELKFRSTEELLEICLRMIRYKKENKELASYLLFQSENEAGYIDLIKSHVDSRFEEFPNLTPYQKMKMVRKILREVNKFNKYSGIKTTAIETGIHFLEGLKDSGMNIKRITALYGLYYRQLDRILAMQSKLHEDQRSDYEETLENLKKL